MSFLLIVPKGKVDPQREFRMLVLKEGRMSTG